MFCKTKNVLYICDVIKTQIYNKMALNETQIRLLEMIQAGLRHGDIGIIAGKTSFSREHVGRVLSLSNDDFNEDIVKEAVEIISIREQSTKKLLNKLTATH